LKTIILYGELAKRFGRVHRFSVKNAAEAIRALKANFKGFENYMTNAHTQNVGFKVFVGGSKIQKYNEIHNPCGKDEIIRIVPVLAGSGAWVRILIGAVLVVAAVAVTALGAPNAGFALGAAGVGLIIGGVAQLLTTPPKDPTTNDPDRKNSYVFNGPLNTSAQGRPVPVGYGRMIVGSVVISAGIETYEE